jgi:hypothetical protein
MSPNNISSWASYSKPSRATRELPPKIRCDLGSELNAPAAFSKNQLAKFQTAFAAGKATADKSGISCR